MRDVDNEELGYMIFCWCALIVAATLIVGSVIGLAGMSQ